MTTTKLVYAYVRVSTERQVKEGESLEAQQRKLQAYAQLHGWEIAEMFVEQGVSGSVPLRHRPEGSRLLEKMTPGCIVIACKLDRMFRSARDAINEVEDMRDAKIALHFIDMGGDVTGEGLGKLFFMITAAFAEAERDRITERIRDVKRDQKARRRFLGGNKPFGYDIAEVGVPPRIERFLVPNEGEQDAITIMVAMKDSGCSLRQISSAIKAMGYNISHIGVRDILQKHSQGAYQSEAA